MVELQDLHKYSALDRRNLKSDGELLQLPRLTRRQQPLPLLVLVDVSGSMERYARLLLAFLHQATRGAPRAAFAFGTGLTDLRPAFRLRDSDQMLALANEAIDDFAGGTRLGASLAQLRQQHRKHCSTVSEGWGYQYLEYPVSTGLVRPAFAQGLL